MSGFRKFALGSTMAVCITAIGCGGAATHTPTEQHDQKGEHLTYPAGGPNSPDYKKASGKADESKEAPKEAAPAEKKAG